MGKLVLGVATLARSAGAASAQVYVSAGYGNGYGYGAPLYNYAAPAYGYTATAPLYNYAAPAYAAPATAGTTIVIVTPAPAYTAPQPWFRSRYMPTHLAMDTATPPGIGTEAIGADFTVGNKDLTGR